MPDDFLLDEAVLLDDIRAHLINCDRSRGNLIPILQMIQEKCAYLPPLAMEIVADHLRLPVCDVYGVATFYNQFRFHPPGRNPIKVCLGTACHVRGGDIILENFERKLEIREGETSEDREFSLDRVACVGCCALAPVALMGETVHGHMAPSKVEGLILQANMAREKREKEEKDTADDTE
jgi:NADH-quinone oxidoreductase subunit E